MGKLEQILNERYGVAIVQRRNDGLLSLVWNPDIEARRCTIYKAIDTSSAPEKVEDQLSHIYGDALGGSLLRGTIQVAMLAGPRVYGVYSRAELEGLPEVKRAKQFNPLISYFMSAANVWYYGIHGNDLYCYDTETLELDLIGPFASAMQELLEQWEQADRQGSIRETA